VSASVHTSIDSVRGVERSLGAAPLFLTPLPGLPGLELALEEPAVFVGVADVVLVEVLVAVRPTPPLPPAVKGTVVIWPAASRF